MNYRELPWDSAFFGLPVASMDIDERDTPEAVQQVIDKSTARLIYAFLSPEIQTRFEGILQKFGALYDEKVFYEKTLTSPAPKPVLPEGFSSGMVDQPFPELYALARASSWDSRFAKDPRLAPKVGELYDLWIEKGFTPPDQGIVGIFDDKTGHILCALMSFKIKDIVGTIELFAVDSRYRRRGLGRALLEVFDNLLSQRSINRATVVTQKTNFGACRAYESVGYSVRCVRDVWHLYK
ncbi:MAG: GNAT family N-acetyltransferase [Thermoguttaceae bacterium]|nr:GNAT family N-acetyltransferase [Thermoguttaceae bacterium]